MDQEDPEDLAALAGQADSTITIVSVHWKILAHRDPKDRFNWSSYNEGILTSSEFRKDFKDRTALTD